MRRGLGQKLLKGTRWTGGFTNVLMKGWVVNRRGGRRARCRQYIPMLCSTACSKPTPQLVLQQLLWPGSFQAALHGHSKQGRCWCGSAKKTPRA